MGALRPDRPRHDAGFTLIEMLVVVIIIGILAGIAIPIFLNQKQKARDTQAVEAVEAISQVIETHSDELEGALDRGPGDATVVDAAGRQFGVVVTDGIGWGVSGSVRTGYCLVATSAASKKTVSFDSTAGGVGKVGGACNPAALPVASIGELSVGGGGGAPAGPTINGISDSEFTQVAPARVDAATPTVGTSAGVGSWLNGPWRVVSGRTPVGQRAIEVTTSLSSTQGVIFYPTVASPITGVTALTGGETVTASAYVKAPAGQQMNVVLRIVNVNRGWVAEYPKVEVATGAWQRVAITWTTTSTDAGSYPALAIGTKVPTSAGTVFQVSGPQVEAGWVPTKYVATS